MLNALVVTSKVTFVPDNYNGLILPLAEFPQIGGLVILDNSGGSILFKAIALVFMGAPRIGISLIRNYFGKSTRNRVAAFKKVNKPVWHFKTINSNETFRIVKEQNFDLIINARTRCIYGNEILSATRLGCINIHHGLLPDQRGTMCDLWALSEGKQAGFSIHKMSEKIDSGEVITKVVVSNKDEKDYPSYLKKSVALEVETLKKVLRDINAKNHIESSPNIKSDKSIYRKNPTRQEIKAMRKKGLKI